MLRERISFVYVVYRELFSSVFHSQVWTPRVHSAAHLQVHLVVLTPIGFLLRPKWSGRVKELKQKAAEVPNFSLHILASPPSRFPRLWSETEMFRRWIDRHFAGDQSCIVQARNALAFHVASKGCVGRSNARLIFDCRGAMPAEALQERGFREEAMASWPPAARQKFEHLRLIEKLAVERADHVCCVSEAMVKYLQEYASTPRAKFTVIPCCPDLQAFERRRPERDSIRKELGWTDRFVVTYCGGMQWYQLPEQSVRVFKLIQRLRPNAHFLGLTTNPARLMNLVTEAGINHADVTIKAVPPTEVPRYLVASDLGLLLRDHSTVNRVAAPVKFGEYLASGMPVVITDQVGDYSDAVRVLGLGFVVNPSAPDRQILANIAAGLETIARGDRIKRDNCVAFAAGHMDRSRMINQQCEIIVRVGASAPRGCP